MILGIFGVPGSGKSYYCYHEIYHSPITDLYVTNLKINLDIYRLLTKKTNVVKKDFDYFKELLSDYKKFVSKLREKKALLRHYRRIVFIIDEFQLIKDDVDSFIMEYHRHILDEICLPFLVLGNNVKI